MATDSRFLYRPEIDGLRALAVIAVIINHFAHGALPSGYLGVDIFFVISGYVITGALSTQPRDNFGTFLGNFYKRRFKRLFPALAFFVLVASLFAAILDPSTRTTLKTGFYALFGLSNIYLYTIATDYFSESAELNVFTHTWSLGVEEQFYLLFPSLLFVLYKIRARIVPILILLIGVSCVSFIALSHTSPSLAYFSPFTRFWELAAGSLIFILNANAARRSTIHTPLIANLLLPALMVSLFIPMAHGTSATLLVVGLTALLLMASQSPSFAKTLLSKPFVVYIGRISYSLYLWHWFVLWLSRFTIGIEWWTVPIQIVLMMGLAMMSYHLIEQPLRYRDWSSSKIRSVLYGALAVAAVALINVALEIPLRGKLYLGNIVATGPTAHLTKTWWIDKKTGQNLEPCHIAAFYEGAIKQCLIADRTDRKTVFLIGDSHARNYLPAVQGVFPDATLRYLTIGHGCAFLPLEMAKDLDAFKCSTYTSSVAHFLAQTAKPGDVVVIGQRLYEADPRRFSSLYLEHVSDFAHAMDVKRVSVILVDAVYPPPYLPERCISVPWRRDDPDGCMIPRETVQAAFSTFDGLAKRAAQSTRNLYYAHLREGLCGNDRCGQTLNDGTYIWHDRGHITQGAAAALAPLLRQQLQEQNFPF